MIVVIVVITVLWRRWIQKSDSVNEWVSEWVTRSPIELSWTAKKRYENELTLWNLFIKINSFLINGFPCQALKIYEMGFLCWCNIKVKKILQEEATKIKQAELNHNYWKSVVFKIFAAKSSWKKITSEMKVALHYTLLTLFALFNTVFTVSAGFTLFGLLIKMWEWSGIGDGWYP